MKLLRCASRLNSVLVVLALFSAFAVYSTEAQEDMSDNDAAAEDIEQVLEDIEDGDGDDDGTDEEFDEFFAENEGELDDDVDLGAEEEDEPDVYETRK
ncbi:hypothetical protein ElyMa_006434300 [Elysia marginata]|uniref:Uncharacterized protein n=1 Tax=Elysia marginata TaxID=1093978 RepID=A0AAV4HUP6_9GAST|nr:hypothetical protein ElyMa_006434300 [Elysia marginata]